MDKLDEALNSNQILVGWSDVEGLLGKDLEWDDFREIISKTYFPNEISLRKAGAVTGQLWLFIKEMKKDDLVLVPYGPKFYVAKVQGSAIYDRSKVNEDTAYRRDVKWLNNKEPIERNVARSALISRMKSYGTCTEATDLLPEINECLENAKNEHKPTFYKDLEKSLIRKTIEEIRNGRMESYGFEELVRNVFLGLGAYEATIVPRKKDKGGDIIAKFNVAEVFDLKIAIQVKHWQPYSPVDVDVVEKLVEAIRFLNADKGIIVTSGEIGQEAEKKAKEYFDSEKIEIGFIKGEYFAKLIVEHGIKISK